METCGRSCAGSGDPRTARSMQKEFDGGGVSTANAVRAGISPYMNLAGYLQLLDWSSRLLRHGKARVPEDVSGILERLGSSPDFWQHRLEKLRDRSRMFGTVFATKRSEIDRMAESHGVKKLSNLNGCSG